MTVVVTDPLISNSVPPVALINKKCQIWVCISSVALDWPHGLSITGARCGLNGPEVSRGRKNDTNKYCLQNKMKRKTEDGGAAS